MQDNDKAGKFLKRGRFDAPLQATYSAIHLPDGSLTEFGKRYMFRKLLEKRRRGNK